MAPAIESNQAYFASGTYRDLRNGTRFHCFEDCPVGSRIPAQFVYPGKAPNGRLCKECELRREHVG
jgi:hypothetical protein